MAIDESTYDLLERYLAGTLGAEERADLEARLLAEEDLREELAWLRSVRGELSALGREVYKKQIAAIGAAVPMHQLQQYTPSQNAAPTPKSGINKLWWVVAAVAVGLVATWLVVRLFVDPERVLDGPEKSFPTPALPILKDSVEQPKEPEPAGGAQPNSSESSKKETIEATCPVVVMKVLKAYNYVTTNDPAYQNNVVKAEEFRDTITTQQINKKEQPVITQTQTQKYYRLDGSTIAVRFCAMGEKRATYTFNSSSLILYSNYTTTNKLHLRDAGDGKNLILEEDGKSSYFLTNGAVNEPLVNAASRAK